MTRAEIERVMAADASVRERVEAHVKLRARIAGAYANILDEEMPETLLAPARPRRKILLFYNNHQFQDFRLRLVALAQQLL